MANQPRDGRQCSPTKGPSSRRFHLSQTPYRIRSDFRSLKPELGMDCDASRLLTVPLGRARIRSQVESLWATMSTAPTQAAKCLQMTSRSQIESLWATVPTRCPTCLQLRSPIAKCLQMTSNFTRRSATMDGRYPSPNGRSFIENKGDVPSDQPEPAYVPSTVAGPVELDPDDIEIQIRKPLKVVKPCVTKERGASSYHSATVSENDRNKLEKSEHWQEFHDANPGRLYYPVGDLIYHSSSDGHKGCHDILGESAIMLTSILFLRAEVVSNALAECVHILTF